MRAIRTQAEAKEIYLHFNSLDLDAPRVGGLVQGGLHHAGDAFALGQDVAQIFCAQNVSGNREQNIFGCQTRMIHLFDFIY